MAEEIKETVKYELGLTVSIGVSFNKIFAKLGSDMKKPDAITVIPKETFREQIWNLPASDMLGVGRATEKKLSSVGIRTIGQIAQFPCEFFQRRLGKCGVDLWRFANGMDTSQVTVIDIEAPDKTVGHGMTALQDLEDDAEVWKFILELCQDIGHRLYVFNTDIYDDTLVRQMIECIKVYPDGRLEVIFGSGVVIEERVPITSNKKQTTSKKGKTA